MSMTAVPISMRLPSAADGGQQRKGRSELAWKMVHAKIRTVCAQFLGGHRELDGLMQRIRGRTCCGVWRRRPVPE
jgi:hypothetical protein